VAGPACLPVAACSRSARASTPAAAGGFGWDWSGANDHLFPACLEERGTKRVAVWVGISDLMLLLSVAFGPESGRKSFSPDYVKQQNHFI
jgi:hypothetical protein